MNDRTLVGIIRECYCAIHDVQLDSSLELNTGKLMVKPCDQCVEDSNIPDINSIANAVEKAIMETGTPGVRVPLVKPSQEDTPQKIVTVDLFQQHRIPFMTLYRQAPKDRFIEHCMAKIRAIEAIKGDMGDLAQADKVLIAALEVVYTRLPRDFWGTPKAESDIKNLIAIHKEEDPTPPIDPEDLLFDEPSE